MALQLYDRFFAYADGQLLGESSDIKLTYEGDSQPVQTMVKDLAGCTPAPKMAMIAVNSFVPIAGLEYDAIKKWQKNQFVTFRVQAGGSGQKVETDGWIVSPAIESSAGGATTFSFSVRCQSKPLE